MKPGFVVLAAWAFSEGGRDRLPGNLIALLLLPATIIPLILQPDFGQTMLVSLVWVGAFLHRRSALDLGLRRRRHRHGRRAARL